jgi:chromosome partitioning protein
VSCWFGGLTLAPHVEPWQAVGMSSPPQRSATIITSLNLKGGVGKTHLCWLIAGVCQERAQRCLVLDLDKQGNISTTLLGNAAAGSGTDAFFNPTLEPEINRLIRRSNFEHIDCIPGDFSIERFNLTDPAEWEQTGLQLSLIDPLQEVAPFYDYILLDCPADISLITYAALCASDFLIVPLEAADWGALGTQHVRQAFDHVRQQFNSRLQLLGYVASRFKTLRKYQKNYLSELQRHFGPDAFETVIADLAAFEKSVTDRIPIVLHSPSSHASSLARGFFDELEARIQRLRSGSPAGGSRCLSE